VLSVSALPCGERPPPSRRCEATWCGPLRWPSCRQCNSCAGSFRAWPRCPFAPPLGPLVLGECLRRPGPDGRAVADGPRQLARGGSVSPCARVPRGDGHEAPAGPSHHPLLPRRPWWLATRAIGPVGPLTQWASPQSMEEGTSQGSSNNVPRGHDWPPHSVWSVTM